MFQQDLHIDGEWRSGSTGRRYPVIDPADSTEIATFAVASEADCVAAIRAADRALPEWTATPPRDRSEILRRCFEIMQEEEERLAEIIVRENGKAYVDALTEARYAREFFRWFAEEAVRIRGDFRLSPSGDKRITIVQQGIGVSVLITPWNFPAAMATRKIAPALAAGCTVVLKPASETPLTAAYVIDVMVRAGTPPGVVNLVVPQPAGPGVQAMLRHPSVRKLSFTGSTEVGRTLLKEAADYVISSSMELGGNAPFIVLPGADIAETVSGAMVAKMRNGGSACTAANRFYVHVSLIEEFTERLAEEMGRITMGPGLTPTNSLGALVSVKERDKVAALVDRAIEEGAHVRLGGSPSESGAFFPPTILTNIRHGSHITTNEIFGPVVTLIPFDEVESAIEMANDTIYGLIAYVYGPHNEAMTTALRIESGMVGVNRALLSDPAASFGGVKQSGLGREGGFGGIKEFLEEKYVGSAL
ncbi:NAD-dependent succinate-semialdehyde dehydrogenase [Pseudactinotalea sp. Z1739]|uniref:NAD-dependent succinate-semialdehyde dehydrogenase n=1 Tax=Pseudactinotalea sp. Z1739 TaxID=3413028 RepID=UPI003C7BDF98